MAKITKTKPATTKPAQAATGPVDWNAESARIDAAAKSKGGSWGDQVKRAGDAAAANTPAGELLRKACGDAGAQALIEQSRNVLAKLPRLAQCIAAGTPWCSAAGMSTDGRRKEDASVVVALAGLGAGNSRQKEVVAHAAARYPGGANAQMPAALEALAFFGIVRRKEGGKRNADYELRDSKRAEKLMPVS